MAIEYATKQPFLHEIRGRIEATKHKLTRPERNRAQQQQQTESLALTSRAGRVFDTAHRAHLSSAPANRYNSIIVGA
jgi:hypothetical protein